MALALAYLNEVLNQYPSTVVFDEASWQPFLQALKFEGRPLEQLVVGRMRLRMAEGGYDGLLKQLVSLSEQVKTLTAQLEEATAPHAAAVS